MHNTPEKPFPKLSGEGWLQKAIDYLDTASMTSKQRINFERAIIRNVAIEQKQKEEKEQFIKKITEETTEKTLKDLAKKFKEDGVSIEIIVKATSLSKETIELL